MTSLEWWRANANSMEMMDLEEPKTYDEAISGPDCVHWKKTTSAELKSMDQHDVFEPRDLPSSK